jgi:hypothetical protein
MIYQPQNLKTFYNWIAYIIACDVLISMFYYLSLESKEETNSEKNIDDDNETNDTNDSNYEMTFDMNQIEDIIESINPTPTEIEEKEIEETEIETDLDKNTVQDLNNDGDLSNLKLFPIAELEEPLEQEPILETIEELPEIDSNCLLTSTDSVTQVISVPLKTKRISKKKVSKVGGSAPPTTPL